jgi:acyl-coenzyme A thioesterase PaaI-like protein
MTDAFFEAQARGDQEVLRPTRASAGGWSTEQMRGPAVSAALARGTEHVADDALPGMRPVRWTVDLFRPPMMLPTTVTASVSRKGRRIGLIDAELAQNGRPVARSRALFARPSPTPDGLVWTSSSAFRPPPPDLRPASGEPLLYNSDHRGWTPNAADHLGGAHKQTWHFPVAVVAGEEHTRFQMAAGVADVANLVMSWGSAGVEFINADITLAISRLPVAMELGLCALDRTVADGIAVGTAAMFDRHGQLGTATVVTLANAGNRVDIGSAGGAVPLPD